MVKKRSKNQEAEDKSRGDFQKILSCWIVNALTPDFGFDFKVRFTKESKKDQEVLPDFFLTQMKSSRIRKEDALFEDLSIDDLVLYLGQKVPVLLYKYDCINEKFYWEIIQTYIWDILNEEDPNWKNKKYKRIKFRNELEKLNLEELKKKILSAQDKIIKYHALNLNLGEGYKLNLEELEKYKSKISDELKEVSLKEVLILEGRREFGKVKEILLEVYNSPKEDIYKLKAIIGLTSYFNLVKEEDQIKLILLIEEGIKLAKKISKKNLENFLNIHKAQVLLYKLDTKLSSLRLSLKIQGGEHPFSYFFVERIKPLVEEYNSILESLLNNSLRELLNSKEYYLYLNSLPTLLDIITVHVTQTAIFDLKILELETESQRGLINQCESTSEFLEKIGSNDTLLELLRSLVNYYYWTRQQEKAIKTIDQILNLLSKGSNRYSKEEMIKLKEMYEKTPDPYNKEPKKDFSELTLEENANLVKQALDLQKENIGKDNSINYAIKLGLEDINPEKYLKFCRNLRIKYFPSMLGSSMGLHSLGSKVLWCKYAKNNIGGLKLEDNFQIFKLNNKCNTCKNCVSRGDTWIGKVKDMQEIEKDPDFLKFLEVYLKN